jgi:hypothetical protein
MRFKPADSLELAVDPKEFKDAKQRPLPAGA